MLSGVSKETKAHNKLLSFYMCIQKDGKLLPSKKLADGIIGYQGSALICDRRIMLQNGMM